jgi:hypothetical protein
MLLVHRRDIIEPIEVGQRLQVGFMFDQLFGAAVKQANMRSTRVTTSPSSSRMSRKTPWAAGCCGPKLMVKLRIAASAIPPRISCRCNAAYFYAFQNENQLFSFKAATFSVSARHQLVPAGA